MYTTTQAAELEALARTSTNQRLSEILLALDAGFTNAEIAELGDTTLANVQRRRNEWAHAVQGRVPTGPDHARNVAVHLRHLLAHQGMNSGLRGTVNIHLRELAKVNPTEIWASAPEAGQLRSIRGAGKSEPRWPSTCSSCFEQHAGECAA